MIFSFPDSFLLILVGVLVLVTLSTWQVRRKNGYIVKLGRATVFAIGTYLLLLAMADLMGWWEETMHAFPIILFEVNFLLLPIAAAAMAYLFYFRQAPVKDYYLEAGIIGIYLLLWLSGFEIVRQFYFPKNSYMEFIRYFFVQLAISPFLAAFVLIHSSHPEEGMVIEKPSRSIPVFTGRLGLPATLLGALLLGLTSGLPALLKFPQGIILLPFLALFLGFLSRSRLGLILSGVLIYLGHILAIYLAVTTIGGVDNYWDGYMGRVSIDFFFLGWWFAILPLSGLGLLGRIVQTNRKYPLAIAALIVMAGYAFGLYQFVKPDISTSYQLTGFLNVNEQRSTRKFLLTLPLPVLAGETVTTLKPCEPYGDQYTLPVSNEKIVESQWGPAWEAELGESQITDFSRCTDRVPKYPDIVPLTFVSQKSPSAGQKNGPYKLAYNSDTVPVDLSLILYTKGSHAQSLSPFLGIRLVWSSYLYEERMDIKTTTQTYWQYSPILPGSQTSIISVPYIEILPFG